MGTVEIAIALAEIEQASLEQVFLQFAATQEEVTVKSAQRPAA